MGTLALLLKESWALVEDHADELANQLYARLFLADPDLRELFGVQMIEQRTRFLRALVEIIQTVDDPDRFRDVLRRLGRDHRKFHVRPEHFDTMQVALIESLRYYAGDRWSLAFDRAWVDAYRAMARTMIRAAERDAHLAPFWHAEVLSHDRRGDDIAIFTCRPLTPFGYEAGQYTSIECPHHPRMWRRYSIANAPRRDGVLEFHVRAKFATGVSSSLVRSLAPGDLIRLGQPLGSMTLDEESTRDIVCIAGGTGFAPIKAIVEQLGQCVHTRWAYVFVGARTRSGLYDLATLNRYAATHPWLSIVAACSDEPSYQGESGPIHEVVDRFRPWGDHEFYIAGPPAMLHAALGSLMRAGVPHDRIHYDAG
jgi:NAD(P)H-flavin reductase/hemoglobin-like flavoprotein